MVLSKSECHIYCTNLEEITMAQLWGGRFTKETDQLVYRFNASISFDRKFYEEDIEGSIAHAVMLEKQGILTEDEKIGRASCRERV